MYNGVNQTKDIAMKTEIIYELKTPLKYHSNGEEAEASFITLYAPSYKHMDKTVPLKQAFYRAASALKDETVEQEDTDTEVPDNDAGATGSMAVDMLYQSTEDMFKICLHAAELFKAPGIAKIEGSEKMTGPILEKLSQDDLEQMLGAYLVNFILASALNAKKKT